jgi:hypothetical protein
MFFRHVVRQPKAMTPDHECGDERVKRIVAVTKSFHVPDSELDTVTELTQKPRHDFVPNDLLLRLPAFVAAAPEPPLRQGRGRIHLN